MINDNYYIVGSTPFSINVDYENFNFKMFPKSATNQFPTFI